MIVTLAHLIKNATLAPPPALHLLQMMRVAFRLLIEGVRLIRRRVHPPPGGDFGNQAEAMKLHAIAMLAMICAGASAANAADKAMFCKASQKDLFAPELFSVLIKQDKIAYLNDSNAFYINYRIKFERGPEVLAEAQHDNGEVLFQIYMNNNKEIGMTFAGGVKGRYFCTSVPL